MPLENRQISARQAGCPVPDKEDFLTQINANDKIEFLTLTNTNFVIETERNKLYTFKCKW